MATILFMSSIQMIGMGVIGEYIRLIFLESKRRPMSRKRLSAHELRDARRSSLGQPAENGQDASQ